MRVSGQQQISNVVEEKNRVSKVKQSSKFQDKYDYPFGHADNSKHHGVPKHAVNKNMVHPITSENCQKQQLGSKADKDEELVKHMSNLPKYLQKTEMDKNVRAKALNFGVIDWNHLEKWKYNERMPTRGHWKASSSSGGDSFSVAGRPPKAYGSSPQHKYKHTRPHGPFPSLSHEQKLVESVKHARGNSMHGQDFWTAPSSTLDGQQRKHLHPKPTSRRSYSETNFDKDIKKVSDNKTKSGKDDLLSDQFKNDRRNGQDGRSRIKADSQVNPTTQNSAPEPQNIVILIPKAKHSPKTKCLETSQISESRTISNEDTAEPEKNRYSDTCSSQESYSRELYPIPHSCPLPSSESGMKQHESYAQEVNSDLFTCRHQGEMPTTPTQVQAKCLRDKKSSMESLDSVEMPRMDLDLVEQQAVKGRHPSPIRRLSFSLGRMSRSFSFKETSAVSQSNDAHTVHKSGPVSSGVCDSPIVDGGNREKANASGKGRSSPMRRLLDPLLRSKGIHSAETSKLRNENLNSMTLKPASINERLCEKKHQPSTLGALLQLTIKDGLPFFKFVVDNSNDILVAAVKQLPKSGKVDECLIYSFYTVSEIKKKSGGWMSQGSKGKGSGFGYNMIGLMKVSSSSVFNSNFGDCKDESIVRESILYSVNLGQVDKQASTFMPDREIAAIMVRDQIVNHNDGETSDNQCNQHFPGDSSSKDNDKTSGNIIAILPGGVHGVPQKGAPSSLIERWKSGGLCDCGGWDVGCKLQVLTEQEKNCNNQDRIALFLEVSVSALFPILCLFLKMLV